MTEESEIRILKTLGDFDKKIRLQISDIQMSVDNSMTIFDHRVKKIEAKFDRLVKFIESFVLDSEKSNFKDYLEDKTQ